MPTTFSFHPGERLVQAKAGEIGIADRNGVVIADFILGGARPFIEKQFMVVLASVDDDGHVWSSVLFGNPGFARATTATEVTIEALENKRDVTDPFWANIKTNPDVGMLFIELGSRRRYRINGRVEQISDQGLKIAVQEAYPNCPKYIQRRHLKKIEAGIPHGDASTGSSFNTKVEALIRKADTMFVASNYSETGADASHRGGNPGYLQIKSSRVLRVPDYDGNSLFNTLGNVELNPHMGLCIPDFEGQQLLQLTGRTRILWDQPDPTNLTGGTGRFWEFEVDKWILRQIPQRLEWEYLDASPFNPHIES